MVVIEDGAAMFPKAFIHSFIGITLDSHVVIFVLNTFSGTKPLQRLLQSLHMGFPAPGLVITKIVVLGTKLGSARS